MKRIRNLSILFLIAGLLMPATAEAQLLKRLKDRAKQRVEDKIENKAEKAVDKAVDDAADGVEDAARTALERKIDAASKPVDLNLGENATGPAGASNVTYRSVTTMDLGALGTVARLMGQDLTNQIETVSLSGTLQRSDAENRSSIIDLESGRFISVDHEKQQFSVLTMEDMVHQMDAAVERVKDQPAAEAPEEDRQDVQADISFDLSVERTGKVETINGCSAEQVLLAIRTDFDVQATNEEEEEERMRGTMYALTDTWLTRQIGGLETIQAFQRRMGEKMGEGLKQSSFGPSLASMGQDPRLAAAMQKAADEMQNLDGVAVRSTMHMILVPEGQALDVEEALRPRENGKGGLAGLAQMAESENSADEGAAVQQVTLMRITTQISDLKVDPIPESHFQVPPGYKEVALF